MVLGRVYLIFLIFILHQTVHAQHELEDRLHPSYLNKVLQQLEQGENIIFTKFGDGEYLCMAGAPGANCDGDSYTLWLSHALKNALISLSQKKNVYIGKWHTQKVCNYYQNLVKPHGITVPFVSYHLVMNDDHFLDASCMHELVNFVATTTRKKILVANADNKRLKDLFNADVFIEIPAQSWSFEYQKWKKEVEQHLEKDALLLIAGGLCSKVLIDELTNDHVISCIDIGSSFDIMGGKKNSRGWQHTYEDEICYYHDLLPCTDEHTVIEHAKKKCRRWTCWCFPTFWTQFYLVPPYE